MAVPKVDVFYRTTSIAQQCTPEQFVWTVGAMHQGI